MWRSFWVIAKIESAHLCKPIYGIINYSVSICPFESGNCGKEGKVHHLVKNKKIIQAISKGVTLAVRFVFKIYHEFQDAGLLLSSRSMTWTSKLWMVFPFCLETICVLAFGLLSLIKEGIDDKKNTKTNSFVLIYISKNTYRKIDTGQVRFWK